MRKTITVSVSEDIYDYILQQGQYGTVSEHIRTLVRHDRQRRVERAMKNITRQPRHANDCLVNPHALHLLDHLRSVLEGIAPDEE